MHLAERIDSIEPSVTLALDARAKQLIAEGHDVVNMAVGEPDFPAPRVVIDATLELAGTGRVRYTPAAGTPGLRAAVAEHLAKIHGGDWGPNQVCICHSAKHALSGALLSLLQAGDEVLIPVPAWASYFDLVRLTGASPVEVPTIADAQGLRLDPAALRAAITPRTRLVMINSPNNPSGAVFAPDEIAAVAELAREADLWLLSDEIYRRLIFDDTPFASPAPLAREHTLIVDGASKAYAMTGYRIGYLAGPERVITAVAKLHSQTNGSPNALGQAAYEAALRADPPEVERMRVAFSGRRDRIVAGLGQLGLVTPFPRGAFYAFPNVSAYLTEEGSVGFCRDLLEQERLALVPGEAFGAPQHVRLSYACSNETIDEALLRLGRFLERRGAR